MNDNGSAKDFARKYFEQQSELYGERFYSKKALERLADTREEPIYVHDRGGESLKNADTLDEFYSTIKDCQKCSLGETRTKFVFGVGNPDADIMFVGEAPGRDEDLKGEPFVGRAGKLLDKMLESIGINREIIYIANIMKCRPPQNRDPLPSERELCEPYLIRQIELIKPKLIVALGRIAAHTLLRTDEALKSLREKTHNYHGIDFKVTYHPAFLLRSPKFKYPAWDDLKEIKEKYL
ncbi:MAG: uracil-DNA glycosylase [bacterium]|nr:uracil-DNA glycosylase [bacterium]